VRVLSQKEKVKRKKEEKRAKVKRKMAGLLVGLLAEWPKEDQ